MNRIQRLRKESGLEVQDRIDLSVRAGGRVARSLDAHREFIMSETLALTLDTDGAEAAPASGSTELDLDGESVRIALAVADR